MTPDICTFCSLSPLRIVAEDDLSRVLRDGFPVSPGHSLIIPRRHVASFFDLTLEERLSILNLVEATKLALDEEFHPGGYNLGINDGPVSGQTILHMHMHLIPRYAGDLQDPRGGVRWVLPHKADYWTTP